MLWVGVDVGGTFTDGVLFDDSAGMFRYVKAPSTPGDPTEGVLDALSRLEVPLSSVERLVHGVTIGTNAVLEGKGAEVWMLTTAGFRDVLDIARTNRPVLYDIQTLKTPPLVPRTRVREINERLAYDGTVLQPLVGEEVRKVLEEIPSREDVAVTVCFLHSYINPDHEQAAASLLRDAGKGWFVCASSEILPQFREYERFNTTALNAFIGPLMERYLKRLKAGLAERGYKNEVYIMTSNGGVATASRAMSLPVSTVLSGPAGGVAAAVRRGELLNEPHLITCDMGGTSTDVCLIENLQVPVTNDQFIGQYANRTPQIEINAVGAGGGSIAWLDAGDILCVGPQSAGADPGPACYGAGGMLPTVTDANLLLHRLSPRRALGERIAMDESLAEDAVARLSAQMPGDMGTTRLAEGIVRIAVARMVSAIKEISIANGFDPRDFTLVAYGGAGPMHGALIAEELEIGRILVPPGPGNFAAFGSLITDLRRDSVLTRTMQTREVKQGDIETLFASMEAEGREALAAEGVPPADIETRRSLGIRYLGQSWELEVDVPEGVRTGEDIEAAFGEVHDRRFGHRSGGATEIVNFRVATIGRTARPPLPLWSTEGLLADALRETREVWFDGRFLDTPVYERERLPANAVLEGAAIVEESGSTTVIPPGWRASVLTHGDLLLIREER